MREKVWIKIRCGWHVGICEKGKLARKLGQKTGSETGIKNLARKIFEEGNNSFLRFIFEDKKTALFIGLFATVTATVNVF